MTNTFTDEDLLRLKKAQEEVKELKSFVIDRAHLYVYMTTGKSSPLKSTYSNVRVPEFLLFNPELPNIELNVWDEQLKRNTSIYRIPRSFIFGEPSEEEKEFMVFLKIKEKQEQLANKVEENKTW